MAELDIQAPIEELDIQAPVEELDIQSPIEEQPKTSFLDSLLQGGFKSSVTGGEPSVGLGEVNDAILEPLGRPTMAAVATVAAPFSEKISMSDVGDILKGDSRFNTKTNVFKEALPEDINKTPIENIVSKLPGKVPMTLLSKLVEAGIGRKPTVEDITPALQLGAEVVLGGGVGTGVMKGTSSLASKLATSAPKVAKVVNPALKGIEVATDVTLGGITPKTPTKKQLGDELDSVIANTLGYQHKFTKENQQKYLQDLRNKVEDMAANNYTTSQISEELRVNPVNILQAQADKMLTAKNMLDSIYQSTGVPLTHYVDEIHLGRNLEQMDIEKSMKRKKDVEEQFNFLGVDGNQVKALLDRVEDGGKISDELNKDLVATYGSGRAEGIKDLLSKERQYNDQIYFEDGITRLKSIVDAAQGKILDNPEIPIGIRNKAEKNLQAFKSYLKMLNESPEIAPGAREYLKYLSNSNDVFEGVFTKGMTDKEIENFRPDLRKNLFKDIEPYPYEHFYTRKQLKKGEKVHLLSKGIERREMLGKIKEEAGVTPSYMKARSKDTPMEGVLETDYWKLLEDREKARAYYKNVVPSVRKFYRDVELLNNVELLSEAERAALKPKLGEALQELISEADKHNESLLRTEAWNSILLNKNFSPLEKQYVAQFIKNNETYITGKLKDMMENSTLSQVEGLEDTVDIVGELASTNNLDPLSVKNFLTTLENDLPKSLKTKEVKDAWHLLNSYPSSPKTPEYTLDLINKIKNEASTQGAKKVEVLKEVGINSRGQLIGDLGKRADQFLTGSNLKVHSQARDVAEDWFLQAMGKDKVVDNIADSTPILKASIRGVLNSISPDINVIKKLVGEKIGKQFAPDATMDDVINAISSWSYSVILGYNPYPAVRDLLQPITYSSSRLGGNYIQNKKAIASAYAGVTDKLKWRQFWASGVKAKGNPLTPSESQQVRKVFAEDSKLRYAGKLGKGIERLGGIMINGTDTIARFVSYHATREIAERALTSKKAMSRLLSNPELRDSEKAMLATLYKKEPEKFVDTYSAMMTNKLVFIYGAEDRARYLRSSIARLLIMFSKYPTEITQRYARVTGKAIKGGMKGERKQAMEQILEDMSTFALLSAASTAAGVNFIDLSSLSSMGIPGTHEIVKSLFDLQEGKKDASEIGLDLINRTYNPASKLIRVGERMIGENENYTPVVPFPKTDYDGELSGYQARSAGGALHNLFNK